MRLVILCGGLGSRLWPLSRQSLPKQFISLFNGKSLLDLTIERVLKFNLKNKPIFICNKEHSFLLKNLLIKYNLSAKILLEPIGRSTCAAIYLAAKYCNKNENLLIMPSDHLIDDDLNFSKEILSIDKEVLNDNWVTLGVKPTKPSEAYGYIQISNKNKLNLWKITKFIEKPSSRDALKFIKNNNYFWNAGIFFAKSSLILKSIQEHASDIAKSCDETYKTIKKNNNDEYSFSPELFSTIPKRSIDYAVMENAKNIYLYPLNSNWSDVGSWDAIHETNKINIEKQNVIQIESSNNFIKTDNRVIGTIHVNDLIIVDTNNATLIAKKGHTEKVKLLVDKLNNTIPLITKENTFEYRPWGKFENIYEDKNCKVKKLIINPLKRLSLQYHNFRSEHWLIVSGEATVYLNKEIFTLTNGQSIDIPVKYSHYIENKTKNDLIIIETQLGSYFGEDDIIRLDDPYFR